ncbi:NAD-dependent epimerase/dehydratase family protein [Cryomorpha ignava]|uniref:NAD-dependent epimerase/dehydratase family protein n=1 Tax=Cryomorpha ignava TaxID=101383 RepID=A0A7K3WP29_9FLAO|nr:NAD-dependent epimerase/dehydratase family protein [Cryomorpha ignava]NEN23419.1 NAD-dependent epimerase/dehydratase family protein [Cryomorpha ignava]
MSFNQKTILITGGLGFIGSHLTRSLLKEKLARLIIIDDLSNADTNNLKEFGHSSNFHFIEHDIANPLPILEFKVDYVFNLAALVSVPDSFTKPLRTHQVNETGFINVLEFCKTHKVKKLVYASSCAVYGESDNLPLQEAELVTPTSPYGLTKLNNERYARFFNQAYGLNSIGLRFFNVFGPGQKASSAYAGVISIFMDRAIKNLPITIYGDGEQVRDFVFVQDIVDALVASANSDTEIDVFNVGTGIQTSVNELFREIAQVTDYKQKPIYAPTRMGDVLISLADPSKLDKQISYKPGTTLTNGIEALYKSISS